MSSGEVQVDNILDVWNSYPRLQQLVWVCLAALVVMVAVRVLRRFVAGRISDPVTRYRMRKFISIAGYAVVLLYAIVLFSNRLGGFAVALGLTGAGIAFGLQETIASLAGWASIATGYVFRTGDRVLIGDVLGDVIDTGFLRTTLMELGDWVSADQYNGRMVRVPNSLIFKGPVFNYSSDFPFLWDEISIPIRHGSDLPRMRRLLENVAGEVVGDYVPVAAEHWGRMVKRYFIEKATVQPTVSIVPDENWVTFTLRYVVDLKKRRSTKDRLYSRILEEIDATGGSVSLASSTLELSLDPDLDLGDRLARRGRGSLGQPLAE